MLDTKPQIPAAQRTPSRTNALPPPKKQQQQQKTIDRHITFKLQKIKDEEKIQKEARGKNTLPMEDQR